MALSQMDIMALRGFFKKTDRVNVAPRAFLTKNSKATCDEVLAHIADWLSNMFDAGIDSNVTWKLTNYIIFSITFWQDKQFKLSDETLNKMKISLEKFMESKTYQDLSTRSVTSLKNKYQLVVEYLKNVKVEEEIEEKPSNEELDSIYERLKALQEELERTKRRNGKLEKSISSMRTLEEKQQNEIRKLKKDLEEQRDQIKSLEAEVSEKDICIGALQSSLANREAQLNSALLKNQRLSKAVSDNNKKAETESTISVEIETLRNQRDALFLELEERPIRLVNQAENESHDILSQIEEELIFYLKEGKHFPTILRHINQKYLLNERELLTILNKMQNSFLWRQEYLTLIPKKYQLETKYNDLKKVQINIPADKRKSTVLFTSDYHFSIYDNGVAKKMDILYEYASKKGISNIFMLGDFWHFYTKKHNKPTLEELSKARKRVEEFAEKLPFDSKIKMLLLGGNHDQDFFFYGYNPVGEIASARPDYYSLGYKHACVTMNYRDQENTFMFHHFDKRLLHETKDGKISTRQLNQTVNDWYKTTHFNRSNTYLDFHGHFHLFHFDAETNNFSLPSYGHDRLKDGLVEANVYFENSGKIEQVVFTPFTLQGNLEKGAKIVYNKKLKK